MAGALPRTTRAGRTGDAGFGFGRAAALPRGAGRVGVRATGAALALARADVVVVRGFALDLDTAGAMGAGADFLLGGAALARALDTGFEAGRGFGGWMEVSLFFVLAMSSTFKRDEAVSTLGRQGRHPIGERV